MSKPTTPDLRPRRRRAGEPLPPALELKDRQQLRKILADPVFVRALDLAHAYKPSAFPVPTGAAVKDPGHCQQVSTNRLHQIQGWEMFEAAIYMLANDPKPRATQPTETYPDAGLMNL